MRATSANKSYVTMDGNIWVFKPGYGVCGMWECLEEMEEMEEIKIIV